MTKSVVRAMPNIFAKNKKATISLLLIILAGGMLFFAGKELNDLVKAAFQSIGIDGIAAFFGILAIALILAASGYYISKKT